MNLKVGALGLIILIALTTLSSSIAEYNIESRGCITIGICCFGLTVLTILAFMISATSQTCLTAGLFIFVLVTAYLYIVRKVLAEGIVLDRGVPPSTISRPENKSIFPHGI